MAAIPLNPDDVTARDWLVQELSKGEYLRAKPNPFDEFINGLWEWVQSLFAHTPDGVFGINPTLILIILGIILLIALVAIFGRPRSLARRAVASTAGVFSESDERTAAELRRAATEAAARGDWSLALVEQYRALARSLADRTLIRMRPGTTAQQVAAQATQPFPSARGPLTQAAALFDAVRYADEPADAGMYAQVRDLDTELARAHPALAVAT